MKLATNFALPRHRAAPTFAGVIWSTVLALFVTLVWLLIDTSTIRRDFPELRDRLTQLEQRTVPNKNVQLPATAEASALRQRVAAVNLRVLTRGRSLTAILSRLETLLPEQAYLVSFQRRVQEGEMLVMAEAESAEPLTAFLLNVEKDTWFSEVLLTRQASQTVTGRKAVQFELRLKEAP